VFLLTPELSGEVLGLGYSVAWVGFAVGVRPGVSSGEAERVKDQLSLNS
jgi:hypothetical protein